MNSYFNLTAANCAGVLTLLIAATEVLAAAESLGQVPDRSDAATAVGDGMSLSFESQLLFCSHFLPTIPMN